MQWVGQMWLGISSCRSADVCHDGRWVLAELLLHWKGTCWNKIQLKSKRGSAAAVSLSAAEVRPHECPREHICLSREKRNHFLSMQADRAAGSPLRAQGQRVECPVQYADFTESESVGGLTCIKSSVLLHWSGFKWFEQGRRLLHEVFSTSWELQCSHFGISSSGHSQKVGRACERPVHLWCSYTAEGNMILFLFA